MFNIYGCYSYESTSTACVHCRRSHLTCDHGRCIKIHFSKVSSSINACIGRPCQGCLARNRGDKCHDEHKSRSSAMAKLAGKRKRNSIENGSKAWGKYGSLCSAVCLLSHTTLLALFNCLFYSFFFSFFFFSTLIFFYESQICMALTFTMLDSTLNSNDEDRSSDVHILK